MGIERKIVLRSQYNGITVRRGSTDFLQWINTFLYFVKNNGELDAINQKWFKTPLVRCRRSDVGRGALPPPFDPLPIPPPQGGGTGGTSER